MQYRNIAIATLVFLALSVPNAFSQSSGRITGTLVDAGSGEALIGANIILAGHSLGAATDYDGNYSIESIPPGTYTLNASMIGYSKKSITGLVVRSGGAITLDIDLVSEAYAMDEVVVEARMVLNNETSLLKDRQKSTSISDAISAEDISRSGASDAAAAMNKVTGASTVDGKYIHIRGLGERYTSTQLNGTEIPSADPNRRAVQLDIFPASFLENLVTTKTFTPDKSGEYTGGSVNINTKSYPDRMAFSLSTSTSWNSQTTGSSNFLTYAGGGTDWLGFDDGTRAIPAAIAAPGVKIPDLSYAFTDPEKAKELDRLSKAFNSTMTPTRGSAPVNQSYAMSFGDQYEVLGQPLGLLASLTYSRKYSLYSDGSVGRYQLTGHVDQVDELTNDYLFRDQKSSDEVLWGGMANLSYKPGPLHEFGFNFIYNRAADNESRFLAGTFPRDLTGNAVYETRNLHYTERELQTYQMRGKHSFDALAGLKVEWIGAISGNTQDEPDVRYFTDNYTIRDFSGTSDTIYAIRPSIYPIPSRYYRNLTEGNRSFNLDTEIPFQQWVGVAGKVRFGGSWLNKERSFREQRFDFGQDKLKYDGDNQGFFDASNLGLLESESNNGFYRFGNYVINATSAANNYDGTQNVYAGYFMVDLPLIKDLRLITGARYESTQMDVVSQDTSLVRGMLDNADLLPAVSILYTVRENMNLRAAYGKTLARPNFRELAPYASFNFVNDFTFVGNANLQRSLIDNYDLRWEWFTRPGELIAVSGFYKNFRNPIERVIKNVNGEIQYQNVDQAQVFGLEFEFRKQLDQLSTMLDNIYFGANFTWTNSVVDISADELEVIRSVNPYAEGTREMQGQSPYLANVNLSYQDHGIGTSVSLYYNVFGERLSAVSLGGTPNVYEQPRAMLDLIVSQKLFWSVTLKLAARNLLNEAVEHVHHFEGRDYIYSSYNRGRDLNFGFSYTFE
jgi:TonB-dependent receptor